MASPMICERCKQPIDDGQLYHYVMRRDSKSDDVNIHVAVGNLPVHDGTCPQRVELVDGHLFINGVDFGAMPEQPFPWNPVLTPDSGVLVMPTTDTGPKETGDG